ncbi:hypothetical protein DKX38_024993 [Salix brachista]|uniref:Uncharacterized protein n=1 Tax=Salix brachista TaxID=2182728 RepID=A0A5N5JRP9_9ROSI|nr:hypothetical protein DKX38_024993 [Salix brachista]
MEPTSMTLNLHISLSSPGRQARTRISYLTSPPLSCLSSPDQMKPTKTLSSSLKKSNILYRGNDTTTIKNIPILTMNEILAASKAQNLYLKLQTLEPLFRVTAESLETQNEPGRAEGHGMVMVVVLHPILYPQMQELEIRSSMISLEIRGYELLSSFARMPKMAGW